MDRKAWQATVRGVAQSWIQWSAHTHKHTHTHTKVTWSTIEQESNSLSPLLSFINKEQELTMTFFAAYYTDFVILRSLNQLVCSNLPFSAEAASSPCTWVRHHWAISESHAMLVMDG